MSTSASPSIHGHDVIALLLGGPHTAATLADVVANRFGRDACFHTCSAQNLSLTDLLLLLMAKGKLTQTSTGILVINRAEVCSHDEPHDHD